MGKQSQPQKSLSGAWFFVIALGLTAAWFVISNSCEPPSTVSVSYPIPSGSPGVSLFDDAVVEDIQRQLFTSSASSASPFMQESVPTLAVLRERRDAKPEKTVSATGDNGDAALRSAAQKLQPGNGVVEVTLARNFEPIPSSEYKNIANRLRGIRGLEFTTNANTTYLTPFDMVAQNRSFTKAIAAYERSQSLGRNKAAGMSVRLFDAHTVLVDMSKKSAHHVMRGNQLIPVEDVKQDSVVKLADTLGDFLFRNMAKDGREVYKFWPSLLKEASSNNMIRQWMASVAMVRVANQENDSKKIAMARTNLDYNLRTFFQKEGELGLIDFNGKVKLGAVALAALAIHEHPQRAELQEYETALRKTTEHLWQENGAFKTFYKSRKMFRNDNHNFYPGEALLYWASLYDESKDPKLLDKFMKSVVYYKQWHLANRNPAFIPWHTQAYYRVWTHTKDDFLRDWVFEMNDWLLTVQQWDEDSAFPDTNGRFYDKSRPFGPPHASSTGVYIEGLIDAWRLARDVGDVERQKKYRVALVRGIRSIMQLVFDDDIDMFYIPDAIQERLRGGVRTTVYDNVVRVDNIQHPLMGIQRVIQGFQPGDYRP